MFRSLKGTAFAAMLGICCAGCIPDPGTIPLDPNLGELKFQFDVSRQDKVLHIGDTLVISSYHNNITSTGLTITGGTAFIDAQLDYSPDTVFTNNSAATPRAVIGREYDLIKSKGDVVIPSNFPNEFKEFSAGLSNNGFAYEYRFVFKKKGLFIFLIRPLYLESAPEGRMATDAHFNVTDGHYSLLQISGQDSLQPSNPDYYTNYNVSIR